MSTTIQVHVNGESRALPLACPLARLIEELGLSGRRLAVERNGEIVSRSQYAQTMLAAGDRLEVVHAIGGG